MQSGFQYIPMDLGELFPQLKVHIHTGINEGLTKMRLLPSSTQWGNRPIPCHPECFLCSRESV